MHAASCPAPTPAGRRSSGSIELQSAIATGQRGWNRQPLGIRTASGVSPCRIWSCFRSRGSAAGTTDRSAFVYGCCGFRTTSSGRPQLDDPAQVHDCDPVREQRRGREVVRDHQDARARSSAARRGASARRRAPRRRASRRARRPRAAAVRGRAPRRSQPVGAALRTAHADSGRGRAPAGRARPAPSAWRTWSRRAPFRASDPVDEQRLLDRVTHSKARVERLVRVLVDDLDLAPERAELARAERGDVPALVADRARTRDRRA